MKKTFLQVVWGSCLTLLLPSLAAAQEDAGDPTLNGLVDSAGNIIITLIDWVSIIGGSIVVLMVVWGGTQYVQGNTEGGKKTLSAALIGAIIILMAYGIVNFFYSLANSV